MYQQLVEQIYGKFNNTDGFLIIPTLNYPLSRGTLRLRSNRASDRPVIDPKYLEHPQDVQILLSGEFPISIKIITHITWNLSAVIHSFQGIRIAQKLVDTDAMKALGAKHLKRENMYCADEQYDSDAFWECIIRHEAKTIFHYSGSCKMGASDDDSAVVDPQLRF